MPKLSTSSSNPVLMKARKKQIEKLRQQKLNVTILQTDVQYRVEFSVKKDSTVAQYSIVINLPPNFPNDSPVLFVQPPCSHKFLDAGQLVVDLPALQNFKKKPDLSSVVKHLISEFEKNPPIPLVLDDFQQQEQEQILRSYNSPYTMKLDAETPTATTIKHVESDKEAPSGSGTPDFKIDLPEFENLSIEELKELVADEIQLLAFIQGTEKVKNISKQRDDISDRVEKIAKENLSLAEDLKSLRDKLSSRYETCNQLKEEYKQNISKLHEVTEWMTLPNLSLTLQVLAAEQEQAAEKIVEDFLEGETDLPGFTKDFLKAKKSATLRKVKEDKIQFMLK